MEQKGRTILVIGGELGLSRFQWALHKRDEALLRHIEGNPEEYGLIAWLTAGESSAERERVANELTGRIGEIAVIILTKSPHEVGTVEWAFMREAERKGIAHYFSDPPTPEDDI